MTQLVSLPERCTASCYLLLSTPAPFQVTLVCRTLAYFSFFTDTVYQATLWTHIEPSVGMVCSCLPSIRGLFPAFSFTKSSSQGTSKFSHGASANHDVTRSNQKSLSYIKMQDIATSRAESDEEDLVPKDELPVSERGITVQTDIVINHAPNNTRGDSWRGAVRMEK